MINIKKIFLGVWVLSSCVVGQIENWRVTKLTTDTSEPYVYMLNLPVDADEIEISISASEQPEVYVLPDIETEIPLWELNEKVSSLTGVTGYDITYLMHNPTSYFRLTTPVEQRMSNGFVYVEVCSAAGGEPVGLTAFALDVTGSSYGQNSTTRSTTDDDVFKKLSFTGNTAKSTWDSPCDPLRDLPVGNVTLDGITFDISSNLWVASSSSTLSVDVDQAVDKIYFLHAARDCESSVSELLGKYKICYTNGYSYEVPVVSHINICNMVSGYSTGGSIYGSANLVQAKVAWRGVYYGLSGQNASVYLLTLNNPYPDAEIDKIEVVGQSTQSNTLGLIAMTTQGRLVDSVTAKIVPEKYVYADDALSVNLDVIFKNNDSQSALVSGKAYLKFLETGRIIKSQVVDLTVGVNGVCEKVNINCAENSQSGAYELGLDCSIGGENIKCDSVKIAVLDSIASKVKGSFPNQEQMCYTMTIGELDKRSAKKLSALGWDIAYIQPKWKDIEISSGSYDFSDYNNTINNATLESLGVSIGSVTWATKNYNGNYGIPDWITDEMVSRDGYVTPDGSIFSDNYTNSLMSFWNALASYCSTKQNVLAYVPTGPGNDHVYNFGGQIYQENGRMYDYSTFADTKWAQWLQNSGITIAEINSNTGLSLGTYAEVPMPETKTEYGEYLWGLWMKFRRDGALDFFSQAANVIRQQDSSAKIEIKQSGGWLTWGNMQGSYIDGLIDVADNCSGSVLKTGSEWIDQFIVPGAIANHKDISIGAEMAILPPPREAFQMAVYNLMTYQGNQACYVYWEVGEPFYNWAQYKPYFDKSLSSEKMLDDVCLLYPSWDTLESGIFEKDEVDEQLLNTNNWGYLFTDHNVSYDSTTDFEDISLNGYSVILDANSKRHSSAYWNKLKTYVEAGGTLVLPYFTDSDDSYQNITNLFGITYGTSVSGSVSFYVTGAPSGYYVDEGCVLSGSGLTAIAKWNSTDIAAAEKTVGSGKVVCLGFPVIKYKNDSARASMVWDISTSLLEHYGVNQNISSSTALQCSFFKEADNSTYFLNVLNKGTSDLKTSITVRLDNTADNADMYKVVNVMTGQSVFVKNNNDVIEFALTYRPYTAEIIHLVPVKWAVQTIQDVPSKIEGSVNSISLSPVDGHLHLGYSSISDAKLRYAIGDDGLFDITDSVTGNAGNYRWISTAVGNDNIHWVVSSNTFSGGAVAVSFKSSMGFWTETVATGTVYGTSIALGSNERPDISWGTSADGSCLKYARRISPGNWSVETVISGGGRYEDSVIVLDSDDNPYIAFRNDWNNSLMFAYKNDTSWTVQTLASNIKNSNTDGSGSLDDDQYSKVLDMAVYDDDIFITYIDTSSDKRVLCRESDGTINSYYVDLTYISSSVSCAVTEEGQLCVCYNDSQAGDLYFSFADSSMQFDSVISVDNTLLNMNIQRYNDLAFSESGFPVMSVFPINTPSMALVQGYHDNGCYVASTLFFSKQISTKTAM
ncbi:MAG: hypothetical protein ACIAQZ_09870 [Sedimentisphaeraceae bacterium JB056]